MCIMQSPPLYFAFPTRIKYTLQKNEKQMTTMWLGTSKKPFCIKRRQLKRSVLPSDVEELP